MLDGDVVKSTDSPKVSPVRGGSSPYAVAEQLEDDRPARREEVMVVIALREDACSPRVDNGRRDAQLPSPPSSRV
jgi:hypothetical protein